MVSELLLGVNHLTAAGSDKRQEITILKHASFIDSVFVSCGCCSLQDGFDIVKIVLKTNNQYVTTQHGVHQCCSTQDQSWSSLFEGLVLFLESTPLLLGLVSVLNKEDSGLYFKTGQEHVCGDITNVSYFLAFLD